MALAILAILILAGIKTMVSEGPPQQEVTTPQI
jgi:hypothetical protein